MRQIGEIAHEKTWTLLRKKTSREEMNLFSQNDAIRNDYMNAKNDNTQQNSKCRLCGDKYETVNHIVSKCSKLAQKEYKTMRDWLGKVIHWELDKKLKFDYTPNSICTNQNPSWQMRRLKFSDILRYKQDT